MRSPVAPILLLLGLSIASCTHSRPYLEVAASPAGGHCATIKGDLDPEALQANLLFACAETTLAAGDRYFRLIGSTTSRNSANYSPTSRGDLGQGSYREGSICFETSPTPGAESQGYDSVAVIQGSSSALQRSLSPKARETLERHRLGQTPPGA